MVNWTRVVSMYVARHGVTLLIFCFCVLFYLVLGGKTSKLSSPADSMNR